jgi:hypothetical protein
MAEDLQSLFMKTSLILLAALLYCLAACNKSKLAGSSAVPNTAVDAIGQKLRDSAGASATDCGRLDVRATGVQLKAAGDCAQNAAEKKQAFFVAYDMPGMSVGVAGNADGKLITVQSQGSGASASLTSGDCPAQLRVASSGRVTCFAPGDMGSMSGHGAGAIPPGAANPHESGKQ